MAVSLAMITFREDAEWNGIGEHTVIAPGYFWRAIGWYALARVGELLDHQIFDLNGVVSGHNLKHIFAAIAAWSLLRMIENRKAAAP